MKDLIYIDSSNLNLERSAMKIKKHYVIACLLSVMFLLVSAYPLFAAERIIVLKVPGCE